VSQSLFLQSTTTKRKFISDGVDKECVRNFDGETALKEAFGRPRMRWEVKVQIGVRDTDCED
jgi:hypothetical protein